MLRMWISAGMMAAVMELFRGRRVGGAVRPTRARSRAIVISVMCHSAVVFFIMAVLTVLALSCFHSKLRFSFPLKFCLRKGTYRLARFVTFLTN